MQVSATSSSTLTRAAIFLIFCFFASELVNDLIEGEDLSHVLIEGFFFLFTLILLVVYVRDAYRVRKELENLKEREQSKSTEPSELIQKQMELWQLSPSEKDVSWLIIKGFSFAEIAHLRSVKEKTIRAQASAIYQKSGADNRNDFAARFIDDMLNLK